MVEASGLDLDKMKQLKELAEKASSKVWYYRPKDWEVVDFKNQSIAKATNYRKDAKFIAAADPLTVLELIRTVEMLSK